MALGAKRADVLRMVLRMALQVIGAGIGFGLLVSFGAARVFSSQLAVAPQDPTILLAVVAVAMVVGLVASDVPARHATRVAPMVALRHE